MYISRYERYEGRDESLEEKQRRRKQERSSDEMRVGANWRRKTKDNVTSLDERETSTFSHCHKNQKSRADDDDQAAVNMKWTSAVKQAAQVSNNLNNVHMPNAIRGQQPTWACYAITQHPHFLPTSSSSHPFPLPPFPELIRLPPRPSTPSRISMLARVAASNTSSTPSARSAEHSRYSRAPIAAATCRPSAFDT